MTTRRETGGVRKRGNVWWIHYRVDGARYFESAETGDKRAALAMLVERRREIRDGTWKAPSERVAEKRVEEAQRQLAAALRAAPEAAPLTVREYLERWLERRREAGTRNARTEALLMTDHVLPVIGDLALVDVTRVHVRDVVAAMQSKPSPHTGGPYAPRSVIHMYRCLATAMHDAVLDRLIPVTPCTLRTRRGELPRKRDKDPKWRARAVYTREEAERLLSDERVPLDRRVLYALQLLGGLRAMEAAGLRWSAYDARAEPLGRLTVATQADGADEESETKTGEIREVPVHPTLAALLAEWRLSGFAMLFGRRPEAEDPIVPSRNDAGARSFRSRSAMYDRMVLDVTRIELRRVPALQHSMRATFLSLLEVDGANMAIARRATHRAPSDVVGGYIRVQWADLCREIGKLRLERRGLLSNVVALPVRKVANGGPGATRGDNQPIGPVSVASCMGVAGFEPATSTV